MRKISARLAAISLGGLTCLSPVAAQETLETVRVIVFPGGHNWPIFVAQEKGFFEENGVSVNVTPTPGSKTQMVGLIDGEFDVAMTAMDNVVAYSEGQGAAPTQSEPDIFAFMGIDNGFLRLVSVPGVASYDDLRGQQVGVDALTTGFAFVLRKMLELGGLQPGDAEFVEAGGVSSRFEGLMAEDFAATLLVSPLEAAAERQGFNILGNGSEALGAYQGAVGAARRGWAEANEDRLVGYIRGYRQALDWLYEPANRQEAVAILARNVPNMEDSIAQVSYAILLDPEAGFFKDAAIDPEGVAKVLELRSEYGEPRRELTDASAYYDSRYHQAAAD